VPTLRDLLNSTAQRPKEFWRGYNVYSERDVGFVASGPGAEREGTRLKVTDKAGSNQGHDSALLCPFCGAAHDTAWTVVIVESEHAARC
jgi:hypothetical protein